MPAAVAISLTDASRHFSEYVNRVTYAGERFSLVRGGKAVAELGPPPPRRTVGDLLALLKALPALPAGEARQFRADLARARRQAGREEASPWES
jgi:antitoxin (DNA-binding transcriptional repressor) of toxin-antitoxin stability system